MASEQVASAEPAQAPASDIFDAEHGAAVIPVTSADPQWGRPDALVTIIQLADFECPFSMRVQTALHEVKRTYGPHKVRIVWKHHPLPFHRSARPAHEAAATVHGLGGDFWAFHDLAFDHQRQLTNRNLVDWAVTAGVDRQEFSKAIERKRYTGRVDDGIDLARSIGAHGTPAFRINGVAVDGAQPFLKFKEVIDEQLQEAEKLLSAGEKREKIYPLLVAKNLKVPQEKPAEPTPEEPGFDQTVWKVPVHPNDPVRGARDALVTIVMFGNFQCPFCKRVTATLNAVQQRYGPDVRIVWKDNPLPFHTRARPAAQLARLAYETRGDASFWRAHDMLFESQPRLEDTDLKRIANTVGLAWGGVAQAIQRDRFGDKFEESQDIAHDAQARGTPHFFINGVRLAGAQPLETFIQVIDEELDKARALVRTGTPRGHVYDELMKIAKEPPPPPHTSLGPPPQDAPRKGKAGAPIVIQMFADFECPFSARAQAVLNEVLAHHAQEVEFVWRNLPLPFHENASMAAAAAHEVYRQRGSVAFWRYHDKLFARQKSPGGLKQPNLEKFAEELGIDMAQFRNALNSGAHTLRIQADALAASDAGIQSTPSFSVNGYLLSGTHPYPVFKKLIAYALKNNPGLP